MFATADNTVLGNSRPQASSTSKAFKVNYNKYNARCSLKYHQPSLSIHKHPPHTHCWLLLPYAYRAWTDRLCPSDQRKWVFVWPEVYDELVATCHDLGPGNEAGSTTRSYKYKQQPVMMDALLEAAVGGKVSVQGLIETRANKLKGQLRTEAAVAAVLVTSKLSWLRYQALTVTAACSTANSMQTLLVVVSCLLYVGHPYTVVFVQLMLCHSACAVALTGQLAAQGRRQQPSSPTARQHRLHCTDPSTC